jgi:hypothetical protein
LIRADYLLTVSKKIEMTNCNNIEEKINSLLQKKEFDLLYELFKEQKYSLDDFFVFYKRNKKIFNLPEFWKSELPHFYLNDIIESDLKVTFYKSYFSKSENCNPQLNQHLICISKDDFIKYFRLWKAFERDTFFDSFKQIANGYPELERVVQEFEIICKIQVRIDTELNQLKTEFVKFSLDDVLLGYSLYYYAFKQNPQLINNRDIKIQYETELLSELNFIFRIFQETGYLKIDFSNNEDLQNQFHKNEAPHHTLGGGAISPEEKYQQIYELIEKMMSVADWKWQISLYISGYADFMSVLLNPTMLETNNSYDIFRLNNQKSRLEEMYFMDIDSNGTNTIDKSNISEFYGTPTTYKDLDLLKILKLLYDFSSKKGPAKRCFLPDGSYIVSNQGNEDFVRYFGKNESITIFDYDILLNGLSKYFKWDKNETKNIVDFLTFDFKTNPIPDNWITQPFLRLETKVLWLNSFCVDRRWENILYNRLKKIITRTYATNFEKQIEKLLCKNGFKTIHGLKFQSQNGQKGEFDILAVKDNVLFVCEAKTAQKNDEFSYAANIENTILDGCAAEQLEKEIKNIKEDWANIKEKLGISESIKLEDVKIIPLIVTDFFEGDLKLYKKSILKTSLLELDVILKNNKKKLFENYYLMQRFSNISNENYNQQQVTIDYDLWNGKNKITAEDIVKCIAENKTWSELEKTWKFETEKYDVEY